MALNKPDVSETSWIYNSYTFIEVQQIQANCDLMDF